jgi:hypothetical protein
MDIGTGKTYATEDEALKDGVPASDLAYVQTGQEGEIVRVKNGPFKDRTYQRNHLGQMVLISAPKQLHRRRNG